MGQVEAVDKAIVEQIKDYWVTWSVSEVDFYLQIQIFLDLYHSPVSYNNPMP